VGRAVTAPGAAARDVDDEVTSVKLKPWVSIVAPPAMPPGVPLACSKSIVAAEAQPATSNMAARPDWMKFMHVPIIICLSSKTTQFACHIFKSLFYI
jgi:hypothetical protein